MEDNSGVVIVECDIIATQCCHVGTDRQSQKAKYLLTLLGMNLEGGKDGYQDKNDFSHLSSFKFSCKDT